jgi:AraC-like DNA-binding protein
MSDHLHFRSLYHGDTVRILDVCCRPTDGHPGPEEFSDDTTVVFPRAGAFVRHVGRQNIVANCNQVLFFRAGETYRVSHPVAGGDDCTSLAFDDKILADAVSRFDPASRDRKDSPVSLTHGPCRSEVGLFLHALRQRLGAGPVEGLAVEESAIACLDAVLDSAYRARGEKPVRGARSSRRVQQERVEAAKGYLSGRFRGHPSLSEIGRAVHYSPYHLARLFRREAGEPIHHYLNRLRLGTSLERLADGVRDLTTLGLELGFSSHSHFSTAFRRHFGIAPSDVRRVVSSARLRELSKNLKAGPSHPV